MAQRHGSATIMILLIMVSITIIAVTALKSSITLYELALERLEEVRQRKAVETLVLYGIAAAYVQKNPQERTYEFSSWPLPQGTYEGVVTITPHATGWNVRAKLVQQQKILSTLEWNIVLENEAWSVVIR